MRSARGNTYNRRRNYVIRQQSWSTTWTQGSLLQRNGSWDNYSVIAGYNSVSVVYSKNKGQMSAFINAYWATIDFYLTLYK